MAPRKANVYDQLKTQIIETLEEQNIELDSYSTKHIKMALEDPSYSEANRQVLKQAYDGILYLDLVKSITDGSKLKPFADAMYHKQCPEGLATKIAEIEKGNADGDSKIKEALKDLRNLGFPCKLMNVATPVLKKRAPRTLAARDLTDTERVNTGITMANAMDQWPLQVITGAEYQQFVLRYIRDQGFTFVDTTTPCNAKNGYHCLLEPSRLVIPKRQQDILEANFDFQAVIRFKEQNPNVLIPCRINACNQKTIQTNDEYDKAPDHPQYAISIWWTDEKIEELVGTDPELEDFLTKAYPHVRITGFKAYDLSTKSVLDQIRLDFIEPMELLRKCAAPMLGKLGTIPTPQYLMKDQDLLKSYIVSDTLHDFGQTEFQTTYINDTLKGVYKTIALAYGSTRGSSDDTYIDHIMQTYFTTEENIPKIFNTSAHEETIYKKHVCMDFVEHVRSWKDEKAQRILNHIADMPPSQNAHVFVNLGASANIFPSQQRLCAASRFERSKQGQYVTSADSGYGFSKDELMYFDKVVVQDGDIYVVKGTTVNRLPFIPSCTPDRTETDFYGWLAKCLCAIPATQDKQNIALAFYDMKRIADGLVIKAVLHHKGVLLTHDKLANIGARLYGCPSMLIEGGAAITSYPPGVKENPTAVAEQRRLPTQDVLTPSKSSSEFAQTTAHSNAAFKAVMDTTQSESMNSKRPRGDSASASKEEVAAPAAKPISTKRPRFRYRAPEPAENLVGKNAEMSAADMKAAMERLAHYNAMAFQYLSGIQEEEDKMGGGSPIVAIRNPSHFLIGCLTELLVLKTMSKKNTAQRDFIVETLQQALARADAKAELTYATPEMEKQMTDHVVQLLRLIYAKRFGISSAADHALKVYMDPDLSVGKNFHGPYYRQLKNTMKSWTKARVKSVRSTRSVKSAPVNKAPKTSVFSKVLSADDATSTRKPIVLPPKPQFAAHVLPAPSTRRSTQPAAPQSMRIDPLTGILVKK